MSYEKSGQPKLTPRKSKGSVTQTYEFPYMINQKDERTLAQMIYDGKSGKFLGRDAKSWGEPCYHNTFIKCPDPTTFLLIMFVLRIVK